MVNERTVESAGTSDAFSAAFHARYEKLNDAQRQAVDTVYGPVMVVAGPGTGKTEVLSMRIAALLRSEAQVQPHEILCLSYSEEAANAMRRRLLAIIGPAAHKVTICTFHAFCNAVIQQNSEYFSYRSMQPVSDLEKSDIMRALIDNLPEGHMFRRYGAAYYDIPALSILFEYMKREAVSPEDLAAAADAYVQSLEDNPDYKYARRHKDNQAGDIKVEKYTAEVERMARTKAAAALYYDYVDRMQAVGRYDYADMILWVIDAFHKHRDLLQRAQERFQFILVDEFQDTNGAQLAVINALTDYWDSPNIFVVGDDDQSIYEFQGARIRNIIDFYTKFKEDIRVIVLPQNYRSSQSVLDVAGASIANNTQRLINQLQLPGLTKDIVSAHPRFQDGADTVPPQVLEFPNPLSEEAWIVYQIERLQSEGVELCDIAVLYAQHKQADGVIRMLERKGIPFCTKRPVNVLDTPLVRTVLGILRYIHLERQKTFSGEAVLFEWMHAPCLGLKPTDIATLALYLQSKEARAAGHHYYRQLLDNPMLMQSIGLVDVKSAAALGNLLSRWISNSAALPLTLLTEMIMHESGMVARTLESVTAIWDMQALHTFFRFVKETCTASPRTGIADFLAIMERMEEEALALRFEQVLQAEKGVNFFTAHGSKGQEFEHVFIIGACKTFWEGKRPRTGFKLPDTLTAVDSSGPVSNMEEVARRLFYVALTRAKKHLYVSYSVQAADGREQTASVFVDEISGPAARIRPALDSGALLQYMAGAIVPVPPVQIEIGQRRWIDTLLKQINLSPSTLASYLRCPLSYYYESLLRVPQQGASFFTFGSAVHYALEIAFDDMRRGGNWPALETLVNAFERAMYSERESMPPAEFARRLEQGRGLLSAYYEERLQGLHRDVEIEYKPGRIMLDGAIPITGRIDKIERYGDYCVVVDYKTGKPANAAKKINPPSEKEPMGGDYWRQMVFYKILLEAQPDRRWQVKHGVFDLVEKGDNGRFEPKTVPIFPEDVATVKAQIREVWSRIQNHEFDTGCGKADCHWCNFARRNSLIRPAGPESEFIEIDD